ncbi:diguanylate cyclase [Luteimonas sp. SX5]|uniref:diguanylate cyclase n=1 Tax=Luteimonas galliterrae TaxID=2940486 RepID=A0ABT0MKT2_9GAMM|nr:diguanylate cyclase [Luteimonas galliterrae]MCL1634834.1 diguanylate cyclase [Luteimonas galliterrae]
MKNAKIRTQTGLLIAALIFVAIGYAVVVGAQRLIADSEWVAHTNAVIGQLDELEATLRDAESAQRGYLLTGDADYLADYRNVRDRLPSTYEKLRALTADNPQQQARTRVLQSQIELRAAQMAATLQKYQQGGLPAAQAAVGAEVKDVSSAIRRQKAQIVEIEEALLVERDASSHDSAQMLRTIALLGIPLGLAVIAGVYWLLVQEVRRRGQAEAATSDANAQLHTGLARLKRNSADLRELSRYGSMLQSCIEPAEALQLTSRMLSTLLPGTGGTVYRMRNSQDHAEAMAHWGEHAADSAAMVAPEQCWALRRGQPQIIESEGMRCAHIDASGKAVTACIPLSAQGVQLGFIYLSDENAAFLARMDIVEAAAEQLSMALSNLYLQERLRLQSIREPLTGLFNRRYLEEAMARELSRCMRRGLPLSLMMLDLDHFKAFNDVHGHAGGDALLAAFGQLLQDQTRGEDIACRYGGEEFTLILPEADLNTAMQRANAIRAGVEALHVQHLGRELPKVTVSIGLAGFPGDGNTTDALLRAADEALYRAKRNGRNRVEQSNTPIRA